MRIVLFINSILLFVLSIEAMLREKNISDLQEIIEQQFKIIDRKNKLIRQNDITLDLISKDLGAEQMLRYYNLALEKIEKSKGVMNDDS